jgi:hypothetical protein
MNLVKEFLIDQGLFRPARKLELGLQNIFLRNAFVEKLHEEIPIIVYQMGKVASQTIYYSLKATYKGVVLHTHTFDNNDWNWKIRDLYKYSVIEKNPLKIISLTREPIARNISAFFQNYKKYTRQRFSKSKHTLDELMTIFLTDFDHLEPLSWFDIHMKDNFGIDVYLSEFPPCGYANYENENFQLLLMRSEIADADKRKAIGSYINLPAFELIPKNVGSKKSYASIYRQFVNTIILPEEYLNELYDSRFMRHFYTEESIERFRNKWKNT